MPPPDLATIILWAVKIAGALLSLTIALVTAGWALARYVFEPRLSRAIEQSVGESLRPVVARLENVEREMVEQGSDINRLEDGHTRTERAMNELMGELRLGLKELSMLVRDVASTQGDQAASIASIQGAMGQITPLRPRRKRP